MSPKIHQLRPKSQPQNSSGGRTPQRDLIVDAILAAGALLFRDASGNAYAMVKVAGRLERHRLRSTAFRSLVRTIYGTANPRSLPSGAIAPGSISDKAMAEAMPALEAIATQPGSQVYAPRLRSVEFEGALWIDIGDDTWAAVRVTAEGWSVVYNAAVPLLRTEATRPLPIPDRDAAATAPEALQRLLNLHPDQRDELVLILSWLVGCFWHRGPYPILAIDGEQGAGKSTACRILRNLVDPNMAPLRAPPKTEIDLTVAAASSRVVCLDNISFLDADMADALCRLATGGALSARKLYTNDEESLVAACNPVLLNGINSVLARGDAADRSIVAGLRAIPDHARRTETQVEQEFQAAAPGIFAALLDGLVLAMQQKPVAGQLGRMADFGEVASRAAPAFGWCAEDVLGALRRNREAAVRAVVDAEPLSDAVRAVVAEHGIAGRWQGSAAALLGLLNNAVPEDMRRDRSWPRDATRLSGRLRRIAPAWRRSGIDLHLPETSGRAGRVIAISVSPDVVEI
jgi:hypothetical protein